MDITLTVERQQDVVPEQVDLRLALSATGPSSEEASAPVDRAMEVICGEAEKLTTKKLASRLVTEPTSVWELPSAEPRRMTPAEGEAPGAHWQARAGIRLRLHSFGQATMFLRAVRATLREVGAAVSLDIGWDAVVTESQRDAAVEELLAEAVAVTHERALRIVKAAGFQGPVTLLRCESAEDGSGRISPLAARSMAAPGTPEPFTGFVATEVPVRAVVTATWRPS
ncbi:hypothetical protein C1Y63_01815 [Corynebacterium sp. 13CS0277]|uniref:SIMPL domain-containing protein n=1 Tax=Corynebacterium sp. 13CS0277 TaxID=2071994 RepID=UPI000D044AAF|nr:SIMPL domain-containing protein [Corynebacterium sp. 13CS0277]PRQ12314.1 hypothetical protein C1Y63_01815 [Corynebacterium sp. 13CS0277]